MTWSADLVLATVVGMHCIILLLGAAQARTVEETRIFDSVHEGYRGHARMARSVEDLFQLYVELMSPICSNPSWPSRVLTHVPLFFSDMKL